MWSAKAQEIFKAVGKEPPVGYDWINAMPKLEVYGPSIFCEAIRLAGCGAIIALDCIAYTALFR